jgi:RHS repeat-associated protein
MRTFRPASALSRLFCVILSYTLLASLLMALPSRAMVAVSSPKSSAKPKSIPMPVAAAVAAARQGGARRREGELIVRFKAEATEHAKDDAATSKGARRKAKLRGESGLEKLELLAGQDADQAAAELSRDPSVELVEPNYLVTRDQAATNDPRFADQWALRNTGQSGGNPGSDVNAAAAWSETTGAVSTVVAVVDGGIDFSHPDLKNNRWVNKAEVAGNNLDDDGDGYTDDLYGWNWVYGTNDTSDEQGHGTSVAGVIAAEGNNGVGIAGVMWHASLMSLKVLDSTGTGDTASAVEAIDYAVAHGASIINCSWGTDAESLALKDAIRRAGRHGVIVVASAGNSSRDLETQAYYPASYDLPNLISVASSDGFDNLAQFSNWGATHVTLAAPGTDILTTQEGGDYHFVSGTSVSVPFVAGIAGLIKTVRPDAAVAAVREAITGGVRKVPTLSGKVSSGGVADAGGALAALKGNPYANGGNNGGNGHGNGNGQPYTPPALRHDNDKGRAKGTKGVTVTPPQTSGGAPGPNLPDLNESRKHRTSPSNEAPATIHADMMCADCSPGGGGAGGSDPYFGTARTQPRNATGNRGVNPGSQNFNWGLPLVTLPGRSGLDLFISLYYNSLVWTKQGTVMEYNADHGTPSPGFGIGLPRLQSQYYDSDDGSYAYILVTPEGGREEMKQAGTGVFESADSSHTQLTFSGTTPVVRTTDGTQYVFGTQVTGGAEWRCTTVEDRNGNYISATYDASTGHVLTMTDTLGRSVHFNYNADGTLGTITQLWGGVWHTYVTFVYGSVAMSPNFTGISAVYGLPSGGSQTVLANIAFADNESYFFDYNSYGQVYQIRHKGPDEHELEHTRYNLSNTDLTAAQGDCPRFTTQYDYPENWNNNQEAVTTYSVTTGATFTHPWNGAQMTGTLVQQTTPDGTVYKEYSLDTGWSAGLPQLSEVWSGGVKKKWSCNVWTQDNTALTYPQNPRVLETDIYDDQGNRKRETIDYSNNSYGLPGTVREYGGSDGQTLLRTTTTDYHLEPDYVNRRIIGLPLQKQVYDGPTGALMSKVQYYFDWSGSDMFVDTPAPATQHDRTNYGPSFITGRGNLSDIIRYDVNDPNNANGTTQETKFRYNSTGSTLMQRDHLWHAKYFDYGDSYSDGVNTRNTFAYVTKVTDEEGYYSTAQYNYDFGGVTLTHTPTSGTSTVTYADVTTTYDAFGRVQQVTYPNGTYKRFVYETNDNYVHTYETITGTTQADEFHSWVIKDGAGRVRAQASDHPGSIGLFSGQYINYDQMGRVSGQSKLTEIDGTTWAPEGDDSTWVYTYQTYDYKGRPLQTTNPDGSTEVLSYGGCGCAGGDVTTAQDEHGRQKRYTNDTLGRLVKVEEMNWDGATVYATTTYSYNARDQIMQISQAGQTPRTFDYDGSGRLWHRTTPEQGTTTYAYYGDDTVSSVTDARGAKINYSYTYRHLISSVSYDLSGVLAGQNVASTPSVTYSYDAAGNRTGMTDGQGSSTYHYDSLSRMDWEQRMFTGVGTYQLSYGYNVGGELQSITLPSQFGSNISISYSYDKAGRLSGVNGTGYAGVSTYASNIKYRAFGSVKGMSYSDGHALTTAYDSRMRPTTWNVSGVLGYNYSYDDFGEKTGRVTYAQSLVNSSLDRSYEYDQVGRLVISHSGAEARAHTGRGQWGTMDGPYSQGYDYDQWGNVTHRYGWGGEVQGGGAGQSSDKYYYYANNRRTDAGFTYDNSGNATFDGGQHFTYNAIGNQVSVDWTNLQQGYDGDGLRVSRTEDGTLPTRYLRSSVLGGQVVAEIAWASVSWQWTRGYVYAGFSLLAVQQGGVYFVYEDPITKSKRVTATNGAVQSSVEMDPYGADTSASSNSAFQPHKFTSYERDANGTDEAMYRRYNRWHSRFDQPDPYDGSYDMADPQSLNRYSYTQGDPVNFGDPSGLEMSPYGCEDGEICIEIWQGRELGSRLVGFGPYDPWDGFWGGGGGGGTTPQKQDDPCDKIVNRVAKVLRLAAKRARELQQDPLDLVTRGLITKQDVENYISRLNDARDASRIRRQGSVESHEESFRQAQNPLRSAVNNFDNNDCGDKGYKLPEGSRELATSAPPGRTRPIPSTGATLSDNTLRALPIVGIILFVIIDEGSRIVFPPRNLVPVY